jgi:hypothetical protein
VSEPLLDADGQPVTFLGRPVFVTDEPIAPLPDGMSLIFDGRPEALAMVVDALENKSPPRRG